MKESLISLDKKRFQIDAKVSTAIRRIEHTFDELKLKYPYLSGLSYFGSRTKATYKTCSDLDLCILYNVERMDEMAGIPAAWKNIIATLEAASDFEFDHRVHNRSAGLRIDISKQSLKTYFVMFIKFSSSSSTKELASLPPVQNLFSLFFLSTSTEVLDARDFVIHLFEELQEGETYFKKLMECLNLFERRSDESKFSHLPSSLRVARKYFLGERI